MEAESQHDLKRWMALCLIIVGVASALDLILRAQMMSRKPLFEVAPIVPLVLAHTHIGKVWLFKMATLGFFVVLWFFLKDKPRPAVQFLLLFCSAGLCLSASLSGHAADNGDLSLAVLADWLHVLTVSAWVGGLFQLRLIIPRILARVEKKNHLRFESTLVQRFSGLAFWSVGLLILGGTYGSSLRLRSFSNLMSTSYGTTLLFKITFFLPLLALGALSRYYVRPSLESLAGEPVFKSWIERSMSRVISLLGGRRGDADARRLQLRYRSEQMAMIHLKLFVSMQCIVALLVLALAMALTQTAPPNQNKMNSSDGSAGMKDMAH